MKELTEQQVELITQSVQDAEERTSAEIVVVIQPRSGSYRDIDLYFATAVSFMAMCYIVFNPWTVHDARFLPLQFTVVFALACALSYFTPVVRRCLTANARRMNQVREAAAVWFMREGVSETKSRSGLLVYISQLEQRVEVMADTGVIDAVDADQWNELISNLQPHAQVSDLAKGAAACVEQIGKTLSPCLPIGADDVNELADRPRVHV